SDMTVSLSPNPTRTYPDPTLIAAVDDRPEWLATLPGSPPTPVTAQASTATPDQLCEIPPTGTATNDLGCTASTSYAAGRIPSCLRPAGTINTVEGNILLTNGMNAGLRLGRPDKPGALVSMPLPPAPLLGTPPPRDVQSGQGLRLQIVN